MPARRRAPQGCGSHAPAIFLLMLAMIQLGMGAAAKCQIILARALGSDSPVDEERRVSAALPLLDDVTTSPASRRPCICLPGARAKMPTYSCANPLQDGSEKDRGQ